MAANTQVKCAAEGQHEIDLCVVRRYCVCVCERERESGRTYARMNHAALAVPPWLALASHL